jgi:hypothetical protein
MVDTVKFNVGGKHFEVSRALIEQNPDTMLSKMISEVWEKEPEKPMFIDRDGDMFAHVLNYLRYGSIELSTTIPQAMFKRELDYYGIHLNEFAVQQQSIAEITRSLYNKFADEKMKYNMFTLAVECNNSFCQNSFGKETCTCYVARSRLNEQFGMKLGFIGNIQRNLLDMYLKDHFGLVLGDVFFYSKNTRFDLSVQRNK